MQSGHHGVVVAVAVIVLCGSRGHLLCHLGCCGRGCCAAWGVTVAVVAPCGVSQLQLLCRVGVAVVVS